MMALLQVTNACSLFGPSTYVNNWLPINIAILVLAALAVAVFFAISRMLPLSTSSKFTSIARSELTQIVLSVILLMVLVAASGLACQMTSSVFAPPGSGQDPIGFAEGYLTTLVGYDGIGLLTNLYAYHFAYAVIAGVFSRFAEFIAAWIPALPVYSRVVQLSFPFGFDMSLAYGYVSNIYLDVFSPLAMVATALMYVQYILLVIFQASAFTLILPVALVIRAIPFGGAGLRNAANSMIALAIAAYIIYPLAIAFNAYALNWIFTTCTNGSNGSCNPSAGYADALLCYGSAGVTSCTAGVPIQQNQLQIPGLQGTFFGYTTPDPYQVISGGVGATFWSSISPLNAVNDIHAIVDKLAIFMFATFLLSTLTFAITIAFAMGLARALSSGVEGAASFWSNM